MDSLNAFAPVIVGALVALGAFIAAHRIARRTRAPKA